MSGWIQPPDPYTSGDYWVTRRDADAAPGYETGLPDLRERYRWNGNGAWITKYHQDRAGRVEAELSCLHSNNGWRLEVTDGKHDR